MKQYVLDLRPPASWKNKYGLELFNIYAPHFAGITELFSKGITGLCAGEEAPLDRAALAELLSGPVSRPEDYRNESEMFSISSGEAVCTIDGQPAWELTAARRKTMLRLSGMLSFLMQHRRRGEEPGDMAVCVCETLAAHSWVPIYRKEASPSFGIRRLRIIRAQQDALVEIEIASVEEALSPFPVPLTERGHFELNHLKRLCDLRTKAGHNA